MKKTRPSPKVRSLCLDLKTQMDHFDRAPEKNPEVDVAKEQRKVLFKNLKEKIRTLSN